MALLKTNSCYIIGTLVEVKDFREVTYGANNAEAVTATIVVKSQLGEGDENASLTELRTFCSKLTKAGAVNKNYNTILHIQDLLNKRVVVSGATLNGERFWAKNTNQLVPTTKYNFNLIRPASANQTEDKAEFQFGGFVYRELQPKVNEDGDILYYQMSIAQANYKEDNMHVIDFVVDKDNQTAVKAIEKMYEQGATVEVSGVCRNIISTTVVEEEVAFGEPIKKTYTKTDKRLVITSGQPVIQGEGEYTLENIKALNDAYVKEGTEIKDKANSTVQNSSNASSATDSKPSKKSALAGLI